MSKDRSENLVEAPWTSRQKFVLFLCALAIVLDGFDTQVIGFAAPSLLAEWGIKKADLAPVLALGLVGMTIGAAAGGWLGDKLGRKLAIVCSVLIFGAFTAATAMASNVTELSLLRFAAGFGLGGALPNTAALVAEFTPARLRSLAVSITIVSIPVGGVVGGVVAATILPALGWQGLFLVAGSTPLLIAAILYFLLPESPQFLANRARLAADGSDAAAPINTAAPSKAGLFRAAFNELNLWRDTAALWLAFFVCLLSNYLYFNWLPVMLSEAGYSSSEASLGLLYYNLGGVGAGIGVAALIRRNGSKLPMTILGIVGAASAVPLVLIPLNAVASSQALFAFMAAQGACIAGLQVLLYALSVNVFPVEIRATGVGSAAGIGRIGAIVGSILGAAVLDVLGAPGFFVTIVVSMTIATLCVLTVRRHVTASRSVSPVHPSAAPAIPS